MINVTSFSSELESSGHIVYTIHGISMLPLLRQGKDIVIIEKTNKRCVKHDTVLFLRKNGQYVLHRILRVDGDHYFIAGDNCSSGETVDGGQIIGVMTAVKRGKRVIKVTDWDYRLYVHLWCDLYPVRFSFLKLKMNLIGKLSHIKRRLFR